MSPDTTWEMVIGLEVHCELATQTKLFCGCRNAFGDEPNTNVCPVCLGLPGSLPVLDAHVVELAMRIGTALHSDIRPSTFARKNYFYPDQPKDYQISQYDEPLNARLAGSTCPTVCGSGSPGPTWKKTRASSTHVGGSGRINAAKSRLVDYNRWGMPLVEIVQRARHGHGEPGARPMPPSCGASLVATGARMAGWKRARCASMPTCRSSRAGPPSSDPCEIKNLNSLRSLGRAIDYEVAAGRVIEGGGGRRPRDPTLGRGRGAHSAMRSKEEANDYRYFPEPTWCLGPPTHRGAPVWPRASGQCRPIVGPRGGVARRYRDPRAEV